METPRVLYFTNWYLDKEPSRMYELASCIDRTIKSGEVDAVYLLTETETEMPFNYDNNCEIFKSNLKKRPTFNDFFEFANRVAKEGDIIIIANTDIYPDKGTRELIQNIQTSDCYALSRYDEDKQGNKIFFDRWDSQDVWIFKARLIRIEGDFMLGKAGCDNAIAERIQSAGYNIQNPSKTIKFNHLHNSGVRNYNPDDRVNKPYLLITPINLGEIQTYHYIR